MRTYNNAIKKTKNYCFAFSKKNYNTVFKISKTSREFGIKLPKSDITTVLTNLQNKKTANNG